MYQIKQKEESKVIKTCLVKKKITCSLSFTWLHYAHQWEIIMFNIINLFLKHFQTFPEARLKQIQNQCHYNDLLY